MKTIYYIRYIYSQKFKCEIIVNKQTLRVVQIKFIQKLDKNYTNTNNGIILFGIEDVVKSCNIQEGDIYIIKQGQLDFCKFLYDFDNL